MNISIPSDLQTGAVGAITSWWEKWEKTLHTIHSTKKPVTTMLTYPWKCTDLHCNHLGNTWKPLVLMTRHFDYCPSASEGDNQSVRSSAPVVSRCFPGGYNVNLYISRGRLAWWLLAFLCCALNTITHITIYEMHKGKGYKRLDGNRQWTTTHMLIEEVTFLLGRFY